MPKVFKVYSANTTSLHSMLSSLPVEELQAQIMELPSPDGSFRTFKVWQSPMMEEALAAKYPNIKTYSGVATDNHAVTIKMDYTVSGFHAMIFDGNNTYFIDPYSNVNDGFYSCYYKRDYARPANKIMTCEVPDRNSEMGKAENLTASGLPNLQYRLNGTSKRTFRLALACTGEYSNAVTTGTPTKAAVLSAMITSVNRVNGVYERELGVHLSLIANEDTLIFLDGVTDPYDNNSGGTMLSQNQNTIDARIGSENYDIGHVFSTGGGGIANSGCVCKGNKAGGVTGGSNPVGDPFDIDYVAHEMGHQFDADHTFNANTGSCNGNGVSSCAYEPGSGTTIMAYAGICGSGNDIQQHSDAYFHAKSLDQIGAFLVSATGATCASTVPSLNIPPLVPFFSQSYDIPMLTPFEITAPEAIDVDHDTLTYCWEQWNRGDFRQSIANVRVKGPIFRSFAPETSRTRVFPEISKVLAGVTSYLGEKLPDTTRVLTFRLTVRDIYNGTGTFNFSDDSVHLDVTHLAGPFKVLTPAAVNWMGASTQTVTWDVANTDVAPVYCPYVDIYLSVDGGFSFPYLVKLHTPNDGTESVTIPNVVTTNQARIKVKGNGNIFFNVSTADFTITFNTGVPQVGWNNDIKIFPVPASDLIHLTISNNLKLNVSVINTIGQEIWSGVLLKALDIPVSSWAKGVYYVQLTDVASGEKVVRPIVIQ